MICILSQSFMESATEAVCEWLRSWNWPFIRLNLDDIECGSAVVLRTNRQTFSCSLSVDGEEIPLPEIGAVWYRRWRSSRSLDMDFSAVPRRTDVLTSPTHRTLSNVLLINRHQTRELSVVSEILFHALKGANWLGSPDTTTPNKLIALQTASDAGLDVPASVVTSSPADLRAFTQEHGELISKPLGDVLTCDIAGDIYTTYTAQVSPATLSGTGWRGGFPSLFQERLNKDYEVRTFFLDGGCHSMAIFSQTHSSTAIDFRHYHKNQRYVPYNLPRETVEAVRRFMEKMGLATGSLDFVHTTNGRTVFLEVNPVGQFGMVSGPCNYQLEKYVAQALVARDKSYMERSANSR